MPKEKKGLAAFGQSQHLLACPVCGAAGVMTSDASFVCQNNHCFDLAAKGYLNCLTHAEKRHNFYDQALFAARGRIFAAGVYQPVLQAVEQAIATHGPKRRPLNLVDVGCGEGYYAQALAATYNVFALDNAKAAIQQACRHQAPVKWLVANLAAIPLQDHTMDVVLDVLTPANYQEFQRLLSPDGVVVKVIPGSGYLLEIRRLVADLMAWQDYSNEDTLACFERKMDLVAVTPLEYTLPLTREQRDDFLQMTPMTVHVDRERLQDAVIGEITIDLLLLVGKAKTAAATGAGVGA